VALAHRGRVLAIDRPPAILDRFPDRLWEALVEQPHEAREALAAAPGVRRVYPSGDALKAAFAPDVDGEAAVRQALSAQGLAIKSVRPTRPNFEDVFLASVETRS
jgi:hypothetical protein